MTVASTEAELARWTRVALVLVVATMAYNVAEAIVAVWAGLAAASVALIGFGLDSVIECAAAAALLYRLSAERRGAAGETVERRERAVHRFVGATFIVLALYVLGQTAYTLVTQHPPEESILGIVLAGVSLVIMPAVAFGKLRAAREIESGALRAEAKETLACSYLSFALLLGLALNAVLGWWWADPVAALLMVPWLVKEGIEGVRGESCEEEDCEDD